MFDFDVVTGPAGLTFPGHKDEPRTAVPEAPAPEDDRRPEDNAKISDGNAASR
ncbi:hypothetical protein [Telmatospirillum sp.]|uniref:hypothetical protein n=1 Tax=Telmatospirillum sp. TaxID=2079197 RepID=UPI00283E6B92|nr:hypothetical protein [Telmatospirillum sp.]MDR3441055.1 hypothetical protein [Telmatospirillum sp.]